MVRFVVAAVVALAACNRAPADKPARRVPTPDRGESTVRRADYIGPDACGECHDDEHARWSTSLHRTMNARAGDPGAVIGDFNNAIVSYAGGEARFTHDGAAYVMTLVKDGHEVRYTVTRTVGRRGLQEFVGVEAGRSEEVRLPFAWWPRRAGWYPQPYFDPWLGGEAGFNAYAPVREPWAERCPWCHSTYPFAQRIARAEALGVGHGLEQEFVAGSGSGGAGGSGHAGRDRLDVAEQVTTGISCESCHLGGRAHAAGAPIHFVPQGVPPRAGTTLAASTFGKERGDAAIVNAVCAQCHSGPSPRLADGTALRNSSEAIDLAASPCTGLACTACHDPHRADARAADTETRAITACTTCHNQLADAATARAHAGTGHIGVTCLDCHMPKVVMGIDRFVRTHRIGSPTHPGVLAAAAPNACNACHLDRSIAWTTDALRDGWNVRLDPAPWAHAYGSVDVSVGDAWLASESPAVRIFAAHAYARSPLGRAALPALERGLRDPLAYVRAWTAFAIEDLRGRRFSDAEYDPRTK